MRMTKCRAMALSLTILSVSGDPVSLRDAEHVAESSLRGSYVPTWGHAVHNQISRQLHPLICGCIGCDKEALNTYAGEYTCGDRITHLQSTLGISEREACLQVAGIEHQDECGICDPSSCHVQGELVLPSVSKCGCSDCDDVWGVYAGAHTCGERIEWLQSDSSVAVGGPFEEGLACEKVAIQEYPIECGRCDPSSCNKAPTQSPTNFPTKIPTPIPTRSPTASPFSEQNDGFRCGCASCNDDVWNMFAGGYTCGERILYLQNTEGYNERNACSSVARLEFPMECGRCDPDLSADEKKPPKGQRCGGAVNASNDSNRVCQMDLWNPTGDPSMYCFAYGGGGDPCHLNNNNDPDDGRFKNPSLCLGDTFYLWDEPDTQGKSYEWAGRIWLEYSRRFPSQLHSMREHGTKVTSPLLKAGGPDILQANLLSFFESCGPPCSDPSDAAYIDVIAINAFCGDFNGPEGCRGGASFIYKESIAISNAFQNRPVYITNWSKLQTSNPQDQVEAIDAIEEFFPSSATNNPVIERVYWFGATDFGGGSTNNFLTQVLSDGSTLGERWREKCGSLS